MEQQKVSNSNFSSGIIAFGEETLEQVSGGNSAPEDTYLKDARTGRDVYVRKGIFKDKYYAKKDGGSLERVSKHKIQWNAN